MKKILSSIWMILVIIIFYKEQNYYSDLLLNWGKYFFFIISIIVGIIIFKKITDGKEKISVFYIVILTWIFSVIFISYKYFEYDYSRLIGGNVYKDENHVFFSIEESGGGEILFEENEIIQNSDKILSYLPYEVGEHFEKTDFSFLLIAFGEIFFSTLIVALIISIFSLIGLTFTEDLFVSTGIGMFVGSILSFFLSLTGLLNIFTVIGVILFFLILNYKKVKLKEIKIQNNQIILVLIAAFLSLNLIDMTQSIPTGWDDINVYTRAERLMAEYGIFPHGIGTFAWTNINSAVWLFFDDMRGSMLMQLSIVILGYLALYDLLKRFYDTKKSSIISLLFWSLPFVVSMQVTDIKSDLVLFFIATLAVDKLFDFYENQSWKNLIILSVLVGFTVAIKISAIIFAVIVFLILIFLYKKSLNLVIGLFFVLLAFLAHIDFFTVLNPIPNNYLSLFLLIPGLFCLFVYFKKETQFFEKKLFINLFIFSIIAFLSFSPWTIYNFFDSADKNIENFFYGNTNISPILSSPNDYCHVEYNTSDLDYKRYHGKTDSLYDFFKLPWYVTFTPDLDSPISDFSFIFLLVCGLIVINWKKIAKTDIKIVAFFTLLYFLIWLFIGNGVIWYGIIGFIGLSILLGILDLSKAGSILIFILVLFSNTLVRLDKFTHPILFANFINLLSNKEAVEYIYPGYLEVAKILNESDNVQLFKAGTFINYFLNIEDSKLQHDDLLDFFGCYLKSDNATIKTSFISSGFTHILIHEYPDPNFDDQIYTTLHSKLKRFLLEADWEILYRDHGLILVKVRN